MSNIKYINPMIGTVGEVPGQIHGGGKTYPGAVAPGGMVQLSPDTITALDNGSGYNYTDNTIEGFSINHVSGVGWYGDLGNFQVMPVVGETDLRSGSYQWMPLKKGKTGWKSEFSHDTEKASAGYYAVTLDRYGIRAECTVSTHTGLLRFTYPETNEAKIIFNLSRRIAGVAAFQSVKIIDNKRLEGFIRCDHEFGGFGYGDGNVDYTLYFCCELSKACDNFKFFSKEEYIDGTDFAQGEDIGVIAEFAMNENEEILLRTGISYVDLDGARNNLEAEIPDFDFDKVKKNVENLWDEAISVVAVEGTDEVDKTLFYTCLYHALLDPRTNCDADGRSIQADGTIYKETRYEPKTVFSGWDVYRSEFPLLTVIRPDITMGMIESLMRVAISENKALPRWEIFGINTNVMVGEPGVIVAADACVKGLKTTDDKKLYDICRASCLGDTELFGKKFTPIRKEADDLNKYGYVPGSLSFTLEDLFADFTMSQFAKKMGNKEDEKLFYDRSMWYKKSYNPETGFMGPKDKDGNFIPVKDEYDTTGCVEANILQQSWFVPHDTLGLAELYGRERFETLLEGYFQKADLTLLWNEEYNHSNEPVHHNPYIFNYIGKPERTQYWVRKIQKEAYKKSPCGFCGNEDVGQLSAWFVLSALGFGQPCLGVPEYHINTPLFEKIVVNLDKKYLPCGVADTFTVQCDNNPLEYPYISEMYLNGKKLDKMYITYDNIVDGGVLEIRLRK